MIIYHKRPKLSSNNYKKYLRGADGIRTRSICLGDRWSTISLPPHKHGGSNIISNAMLKINGQIDPSTTLRAGDVRIYNYALTATQVKDVYNNGAVNFSPVTGSP